MRGDKVIALSSPCHPLTLSSLIPSLRLLGRSNIPFHHPHAPAGFREFYTVHVSFHEQDSAAGTFEEIFFCGRVRDVATIEARAFIFDDDLGLAGGYAGLNAHLLFG